MPARLRCLTLRGFRTVRDLSEFGPQPINVLIGANGAGKSNLISFFNLLGAMVTSPGNLQGYVAGAGGANAILHDGARVTRDIEACLAFESEDVENRYEFRLSYAAGDTLVFGAEGYGSLRSQRPVAQKQRSLGGGYREAAIVELAEQGDWVARQLVSVLRKCVLYQFHNTSATGRLRGKWNVNDSYRLKEDAANLAPFLLRLRDSAAPYYRRIVETLRLVVPFFADFELVDDHGAVLLQWRERDSDVVFDVSQASDGMLRTMALLALLGQPEEDLPGVLLVDEPELGLHPYAMDVIAGMLRAASLHVQVFVATQSTALVDRFEPEDIVVVDRVGRESVFKRLDARELRDWLEEYSLSELWEKNVLGGRPGR